MVAQIATDYSNVGCRDGSGDGSQEGRADRSCSGGGESQAEAIVEVQRRPTTTSNDQR